MSQKGKTAKQTRPHASLLTKLLVVVLLAAIGWRLYDLRGQIAAAQAEKESYTAQVAQKEQENTLLKNDIADGATSEKMEEIARDELGLVTPGEYVFYDTSN